MKKYYRILPIAVITLLLSSTQLYALDSTGKVNPLLDQSSRDFEEIAESSKQTMYLLNDTKITAESSPVSTVIESQGAGTTVSIIQVDGDMCRVITQSGNIGYVSIDALTSQPEYVFVKENVTLYAKEGTEVKSIPFDDGNVVTTLNKNDEIHVTGSSESLKYWQIEKDGNTYYVDHDQMMAEKEVEKPKAAAQAAAAAADTSTETESAASSTVSYNGAVLTPMAGTIIGPSGKETYYNLNMSGVVSMMKASGVSGDYWVRDDGVKMLGDYIMVAANLGVHPRGSLVQTSLGVAMVCDTGGFASANPYQLDIAVAW